MTLKKEKNKFNISISVVTVTYNNVLGLVKTIDSLRKLEHKPDEILVIDGGSNDGTLEVLKKYSIDLPELKFVSERDKGIYDAMNKGKLLAKGQVVHYLNAGDIVFGEPYLGVLGPLRLPVEIFTTDDKMGWSDFVKMRGYGYCHQGILFPSSHATYDTRYKIAGDFDVIMRTFPNGLYCLPISCNGGVRYYLGGVSSNRSFLLDTEVIVIAQRNRGVFSALYFFAFIATRRFVPRFLRRLYVRLRHDVS